LFSFHKVHCVSVARNFPSKKVFLSIVFGRFPIPSFGAFVDNFNDLVDKDDNLILKAFSSFCELTDPTHAVNKLNSFPRFAQVYPGISLREAV
jgi:hypothetical protein